MMTNRKFKAVALFWLCAAASVALGADGPRALPPDKLSAAALTPLEVASRVAARFIGSQEPNAHYMGDLQFEALLILDDATAQRRYLEFVKNSLRARPLRKEYPADSYVLRMFSDIRFELFKRAEDPEYLQPFLSETRKYRNEVLRARDGSISYFRNEWAVLKRDDGTIYLDRQHAPLLLDQVQEYASRMARAGSLTGDKAFHDEAVDQIQRFRKALRDPSNGLWAHGRGWYESADKLTDVKWGRGHGWLLRGLVETLTFLPPGSPQALQVSNVLQETAASLLKYQDADGFWHQVVDRPDSYAETSGTGMISYYLARAVRQGLLPETPYRAASAKAFAALARSKVSADGEVFGGSRDTPPLSTLDAYLQRATPVDDAHGIAAVIFAAVGQLLLERQCGP